MDSQKDSQNTRNRIRKRIHKGTHRRMHKKTLQKDFKLLEKKTIFQNTYTGDRKNSRFFSILREQIFENPDSTPDLGSVFDVN